jgi:putative ABC transport system substrate-binding protein
MVLSPRELADTGKPGVLGISMDTDPGPKFEVLRAIKPGVKKVGAVYDPAESGEQVQAAAAAAVKAGLEFEALPVASPGEAPKAVERLMSGVDAFMLFFDRTVMIPQTIEAVFFASFRSNVPVIGFSEKYAALGALFSIEARTRDLAREAWKQTEACLADRENCRGIKQPATTGRLVINKKTADKMGLSIPDSIMAKASLVE